MRETPLQYRDSKGTSLPLRLVPPAGNPLANTVSECEANDQNDCNYYDFRHWPT
jgi:hypothetical protein